MKTTFSLRRVLSEFFAAFVLTYAVSASLSLNYAVPTPLVAALVLMVLAYLLGPVSGAHANPAVTIGLFSLRKMTFAEALNYVIAQLLGAFVASLLLQNFVEQRVLSGNGPSLSSIGELLGSFVFVFGVATIVQRKVTDVGGLVVGFSLFVGITLASASSLGIINPAVALGLGVLNPTATGLASNLFAYALMPIIGGFLGAQAARWIMDEE